MLDKIGGVNHQLLQPNQHEKTTRDKTEIEDKLNDSIVQRSTLVNRIEMEKMVQGMNDSLKPVSTHLKFEFHDELKEYYVSIVDNVTQEVVKEIPPKKLLDMYAAMTDFLGILVDKKI